MTRYPTGLCGRYPMGLGKLAVDPAVGWLHQAGQHGPRTHRQDHQMQRRPLPSTVAKQAVRETYRAFV